METLNHLNENFEVIRHLSWTNWAPRLDDQAPCWTLDLTFKVQVTGFFSTRYIDTKIWLDLCTFCVKVELIKVHCEFDDPFLWKNLRAATEWSKFHWMLSCSVSILIAGLQPEWKMQIVSWDKTLPAQAVHYSHCITASITFQTITVSHFQK